MTDYDCIRKAIPALIEIVSDGEWKADSSAAREQAQLYVFGIRDARIADVTFQAVTLARMIGRE